MRVASDVGATFADLVYLDERTGTIGTAKSTSSPRDFSVSVLDTLEKAEIDPTATRFFVHGSTVIINALTERKGSRRDSLPHKAFVTCSRSPEPTERLSRLQWQMACHDVDLVAIAPTANMRYLLGFAPFADERPCALLVTRDDARIVVPELNADHVEAYTGLTPIRWADAAGPHRAFAGALDQLGVRPGGVLAADNTMRADVLLFLQALIAPRESLASDKVMAALRMRKSGAEIESMARAAAMADIALMAGADACRPGVSEREISEQIANSFRTQGADQVDFTIVGSGPNGAFPHHEFSDRCLQKGDMVILDIGATLDGYHSDVTRVVHLGEPSAEECGVFEAVLEANLRGRQAAVAGARACDVDRAARKAIDRAGYGQQFIHRTGHGIGLEVHEPPWITSENDTLLEPGMAFSVEPGLYLPGRFGVRIEDIVTVTEGESRCLTGLDRAMIIR